MIRNFRDLSGIKNSRGQVIPSGMLFRSANLSAEAIYAALSYAEKEKGEFPLLLILIIQQLSVL